LPSCEWELVIVGTEGEKGLNKSKFCHELKELNSQNNIFYRLSTIRISLAERLSENVQFMDNSWINSPTRHRGNFLKAADMWVRVLVSMSAAQ
jgi:hypothetical protein